MSKLMWADLAPYFSQNDREYCSECGNTFVWWIFAGELMCGKCRYKRPLTPEETALVMADLRRLLSQMEGC